MIDSVTEKAGTSVRIIVYAAGGVNAVPEKQRKEPDSIIIFENTLKSSEKRYILITTLSIHFMLRQGEVSA